MAGVPLTDQLVVLTRQTAEWFGSLPYKTVHKAILALLFVWLLASLVQLITLFWPSSIEQPATVQTGSAQPAPQVSRSVDIQRLQAIPLFGEEGQPLETATTVQAEYSDAELNATKTRLNLVLEGIVYTADSKSSMAVIVYQGKQDQYYIGDKLPVGSRVELVRVFIDHVILDNAGSYESLWLYDDEKNNNPPPTARRVVKPVAARPQVTDIRDDEEASNLASDYRDRLYKNPSSLAEVLRIAPAQDEGQLIGYRISPGRDRQQFAELGFESNDIVTSINGITLDEPAKALEIYKLMRTAKEAAFTVDRNGEPVEVLVSLDDE